ncbi:transcriptional regulator [Roseateles sp. DAIF2]|uniref:transcriptional regulator n=1 Tax=Roseateles sp. DAIF2 TaxID=2714952 RepID=UPI0018A32962|nr:transcriptional regulator [Roseateles sp. DAIF2]QPF74212.1 transcriptional regulator [Roseateles sp. DAIF2]
MSDKPLSAPMRKTCDLCRLLAGHVVLGLAPGEIAKGIGVSPSWVSVNLPALAAETGFVEQVPGTNRWRLGPVLARIGITVATELNAARQNLDDLSRRYATPL